MVEVVRGSLRVAGVVIVQWEYNDSSFPLHPGKLKQERESDDLMAYDWISTLIPLQLPLTPFTETSHFYLSMLSTKALSAFATKRRLGVCGHLRLFGQPA